MGNKLENETKPEPLCGEDPRKRQGRRNAVICDRGLKECPYYELATKKNLHPTLHELEGTFGFCRYYGPQKLF